MNYKQYLNSIKHNKITKNFTLYEVLYSETALNNNIDNRIYDDHVLQNAINLIETILQPIRDHFGKPVHVLSFYRSTLLNEAINGSKNSQHTKGEAVDIRIKDVSFKQLANFIMHNCEYDQIIIERDLIHISLKRNRREFIANGAKFQKQ